MVIKRRWDEGPFLSIASPIVFGHRERWNGTGYPFGLHGENILLLAPLVTMANVYDAWTGERAYKQTTSHEDAKGGPDRGAEQAVRSSDRGHLRRRRSRVSHGRQERSGPGQP